MRKNVAEMMQITPRLINVVVKNIGSENDECKHFAASTLMYVIKHKHLNDFLDRILSNFQ